MGTAISLEKPYTFKGMVTVSSWLPEDEVMTGNMKSIKDIRTIILIEPQHRIGTLGGFVSPGPDTHEWITIPFDIEELLLMAINMGMLPKT